MTVTSNGRTFLVTQTSDGLFAVAEMEKPVGVFSIDPDGSVGVRGWYTNTDDAIEVTLEVGRQVAAQR